MPVSFFVESANVPSGYIFHHTCTLNCKLTLKILKAKMLTLILCPPWLAENVIENRNLEVIY